MRARRTDLRGVVSCTLIAGVLFSCGCASQGAPWTIQCLELQGPDRVRHMEQIAETLERTPGIRAQDVWHTDDPDGFARLYYGTYHRRTDPATGRRPVPPEARRDLQLLRQLGTGPGKVFFLRAMLVRMPTPNVGNPDWALARAGGVYSLQVGAFEPTDDFWEHKKAAAQYCALLRKKGFEAYYHHGPGCSTVTVGSFGRDAVIPQPRGLGRYSAEVMALQEDKLLKYNLVNGAIIRRRIGAGPSVPIPSQVVKVPRVEQPGSW